MSGIEWQGAWHRGDPGGRRAAWRHCGRNERTHALAVRCSAVQSEGFFLNLKGGGALLSVLPLGLFIRSMRSLGALLWPERALHSSHSARARAHLAFFFLSAILRISEFMSYLRAAQAGRLRPQRRRLRGAAWGRGGGRGCAGRGSGACTGSCS